MQTDPRGLASGGPQSSGADAIKEASAIGEFRAADAVIDVYVIVGNNPALALGVLASVLDLARD